MSSVLKRGSLERYFQVSLLLLVASGFATLACTGRLDFPAILLVSSALLFRICQTARGQAAHIPEAWTTRITLLYIGIYLLDYFFVSREFVAATVHLVLFAMVVKIFAVHRDRDYLYLALLAFMQVLAASVLTVDTLFLAAFGVFLLLAVNTFISFEMRRSGRSASACAREAPQTARKLPRMLAYTTTILVASILLVSVAIFFLLPRVSAGYMGGALASRNEITTGFSNEVNLGKIGEIKQLSSIVMHVQVYGSAPARFGDLRLRGVALGLFDGRRWSNPAQQMELLMPASVGAYDLSRLQEWPKRAEKRRVGQSFGYRVLMEPIGTTVFFLIPTPQVLLGPYRALGTDSGAAIYNGDPDRRINSYEAVSSTEVPAPEQLRAARGTYPAEVQLRYLQLPRRLDKRIRVLAEETTARAANAYDKALAIESHLKTHYGYTLQLPATPVRDPVASFLFDRRQGHCEFFASSMAVMLRTLGIPARLVNGFRGGEFNSLTASYIIRARDAHTWVEAYFPDYGWITFDPTPPDPRSGNSFVSRLMLYVDAAREFWREWIINYDFSHQQNLTISTLAHGRMTFEAARDWLQQQYHSLLRRTERMSDRVRRSPEKWAAVISGAILLMLLLINLRRLLHAFRRMRLTRHPDHAPSSAATLWYERLQRYLARRGWRKLPSQTPQEFAEAIDSPEIRAAVTTFTVHYERARFSGSVQDAQRLPVLFESVRASRTESSRTSALHKDE